jgi:NADPH:quinone reductase-like Zn-dependent oxidoreductase
MCATTPCAVRAAILHEYGATPRFGDFPEPGPVPGHVMVDVAAAAIHHFDLHKATGTFYTGPPPLPSVVGTNGVGFADGRRVYFDDTAPPHGSMAERALVPQEALFDIADGVEDAVAAALGSSGLGAWLAVAWRSGLRPGETVLVLGACGAVGTVAVQAAKLHGAGRVVAAARPGERLQRMLERGADAVVELDGDDLADAIREAAGGAVDVTIDTLWGEPAVAAMNAAARYARHVQVGQLAGVDITLPAPLIRSASLDVRGFSVAQPPVEVRREGYLRMTEHAARGDLVVDLERHPLEHVDVAWERQREATGGAKLVLVPERSQPT